MKLSIQKIQEFNEIKKNLPANTSIKELDNILTMLGFEVEEVIDYAEKYKGFVTAYVVNKEQHPNADKLSLCEVEYGDNRQIVVCGAPNVAAGQKIVLGLEGAIVPSAGFKLEKRKIRGIESNGMICSKAELGLSEDHSGIWVLPENTETNIKLADYLNANDVILDLGLTPNKASCLSHFGVALELAAYYDSKLELPTIQVNETGSNINDLLKVEILNSEDCPRYAARVIENVKIGESPTWLKSFLEKVGIRSINNVVDVTNYVLITYGQPLHAFDYDKISNKKIIIANANENEKFITLDSKQRELKSNNLMIKDSDKSIAIAGVMGGENSEIDNSTKNIVIESAFFKPQSIRKSAKQHNIQSDASYRFERGVDIDKTIFALDLSAKLIAEIADGSVAKGIIDKYPNPIENLKLTLELSYVKRILGIDVDKKQIIRILENLHFEIVSQDEKQLTVTVPRNRHDVAHSIDLIEEVLRYYHYDNIPLSSDIKLTSNNINERYSENIISREILDFAISRGYNQVFTHSQTDKNINKIFKDKFISIENPLGEELSAMRVSSIPAMLKIISHNLRHGNKDLRLIDIGKVFYKSNQNNFIQNIEEINIATVALCGNKQRSWNQKENENDFFMLKGLVEELFEKLKFKGFALLLPKENKEVGFKSYLEIVAYGKVVGIIGIIDNKLKKQFEVDNEVFLASINLDLLKQFKQNSSKYTPISTFPKVERDLAFTISDSVLYADLYKEVKKTSSQILKDINLFDVYKGKNLEVGKVSLALSLYFEAFDRTLTTEEIDIEVENIIKQIQNKFSAQLRK